MIKFEGHLSLPFSVMLNSVICNENETENGFCQNGFCKKWMTKYLISVFYHRRLQLGSNVVSWSVPKTLSIGKLGIDQELLSVTQTLGLKQVGNAPILYVFLYMFVLAWNKVFSSTPSQVPVSAHCSYHKEWMEKKLEKPDPSALGIMRAWTPWAWGRVWTRLSQLWWLGQWWWVQF